MRQDARAPCDGEVEDLLLTKETQGGMVSKIKNVPGIAWLVIGVRVTALVLPSAAYAAGALKFTVIEGTVTNKADVGRATAHH